AVPLDPRPTTTDPALVVSLVWRVPRPARENLVPDFIGLALFPSQYLEEENRWLPALARRRERLTQGLRYSRLYTRSPAMRAILRTLVTVLLPGIVVAALWAAPACADVVTDWNVTTNALVANDVGNNPRLRTLAMVHVAMSGAINTVQNRYTRVVATLPGAPGASAEAAAATAARQILIQIYPEQKAKIEEAYAASLKAIPDGPARTEGIKLGMAVAQAGQADRANDGPHAPRPHRPRPGPPRDPP